MIPLLVFGAAAGLAALSQQDRRPRFGGASLDGKLGPELIRHNLSGVRGRPLWWRTHSSFSGTSPWRDAVQLASVGKNAEAKALFRRSYPDLVAERRSIEPGRVTIVSPYVVLLGLGDQIRIDPIRASRKLLEVYPELRDR